MDFIYQAYDAMLLPIYFITYFLMLSEQKKTRISGVIIQVLFWLVYFVLEGFNILANISYSMEIYDYKLKIPVETKGFGIVAIIALIADFILYFLSLRARKNDDPELAKNLLIVSRIGSFFAFMCTTTALAKFR